MPSINWSTGANDAFLVFISSKITIFEDGKVKATKQVGSPNGSGTAALADFTFDLTNFFSDNQMEYVFYNHTIKNLSENSQQILIERGTDVYGWFTGIANEEPKNLAYTLTDTQFSFCLMPPSVVIPIECVDATDNIYWDINLSSNSPPGSVSINGSLLDKSMSVGDDSVIQFFADHGIELLNDYYGGRLRNLSSQHKEIIFNFTYNVREWLYESFYNNPTVKVEENTVSFCLTAFANNAIQCVSNSNYVEWIQVNTLNIVGIPDGLIIDGIPIHGFTTSSTGYFKNIIDIRQIGEKVQILNLDTENSHTVRLIPRLQNTEYKLPELIGNNSITVLPNNDVTFCLAVADS